MRKYILRIISSLCVLLMLVSCVRVSAFASEKQPKITYVKGRNNVSESYRKSKYYTNMTELLLTGDNISDLLAVALSQLGYMESDADGDFAGTTGGSDNYTEFNYNMGDFGSGYGGSKYDWCAAFVSFCLLQSRSTSQNSMSDWCRNHVADEASEKYDPEYANYIWREVGCQKWADNLISAGYYQSSLANGGEYLPKSGDLIFFRWSPDKQIGHIGIVVYCDGERVYTVEGNTSGGTTMVANGGAVYFKNYALDYSCIDGYGALPYKTDEDVEKVDYSGNDPSVGFYMTTAEKYLYSEKSLESEYTLIPAYTMIKVTEVVEDGIGGMLRAVYDIDGEAIEGYIVNGAEERVIQLTAGLPKHEPKSFLSFDKTEGFIGGEIEGYTLNNAEISLDDAVIIRSIGRVVVKANFD
ncbi:MAG: CHAP domain-containing protein, partial [Clostridia bacterium]|nr:CHAP domain-containing protein [Clostridia bacterium]